MQVGSVCRCILSCKCAGQNECVCCISSSLLLDGGNSHHQVAEGCLDGPALANPTVLDVMRALFIISALLAFMRSLIGNQYSRRARGKWLLPCKHVTLSHCNMMECKVLSNLCSRLLFEISIIAGGLIVDNCCVESALLLC